MTHIIHIPKYTHVDTCNAPTPSKMRSQTNSKLSYQKRISPPQMVRSKNSIFLKFISTFFNIICNLWQIRRFFCWSLTQIWSSNKEIGKKYVISIEEYNQGKWHNLLKSLNSEIFLKQCLVFKEIHSVLFFSSTSLFYLTCNTCALNIFILLVKVAIKWRLRMNPQRHTHSKQKHSIKTQIESKKRRIASIN